MQKHEGKRRSVCALRLTIAVGVQTVARPRVCGYVGMDACVHMGTKGVVTWLSFFSRMREINLATSESPIRSSSSLRLLCTSAVIVSSAYS
jgi:hypothetical protein